jgi:glycosyltransferase involved in cell wall biosynthesis
VKLTPIDAEARIATARGGVLVCARPVRGSEPEACLRRLAAHTPPDVPILLLGELGKGEVDLPSPRALYHLAGGGPAAQAAGIGVAVRISAPADLVLLPSSCLVAEGWLEGLRAAAYSDSRIATATALAAEELGSLSVEAAAAAVRAASLRLRPGVSAPGGCLYIRRSALDLAWPADAGPEEPGFPERCVRAGLAHVLADDVLVLDADPARRSAPPLPAGEEEGAGALARSLSRVRRILQPPSVLIDARILAKPPTGVQLHVLEVIGALLRTGRVRVSALVPPRMNDATARLDRLEGLELLGYPDAQRRDGGFDVVHRPFQVSDPGEITFLASLGERLLVTHHDLIDYHNPAHFTSEEAWRGYRRLTRVALGSADRVLFCSRHARGQALAEGLLEPSRATVIPNGVDHPTVGEPAAGPPPSAVASLPADAELMLCLGNDYRHKNRLFALRLLESLRARHGFQGRLVLAGPAVPVGSSRPEEAAWLAAHPEAAALVVDVGAVSEPDKAWLLHRADVVLYPTVHEGFGLVPFEAAAHGTPCMWAPGTALSEALPDAAATLIPWDAEASAEVALELLRVEAARRRNLEAIAAAGAALTWDAAAGRLLEAYEATCDAAPTLASALARRHRVLGGTLSEDAMRLVGPGGRLPADLERPLLAVATHPGIATPLFGALRLGYRVGRRLGRWRGAGVAWLHPGAQRRR